MQPYADEVLRSHGIAMRIRDGMNSGEGVVRTIRAKVTGQILTLDETLQDIIPALISLLDALPEDSPFLELDPPQRRQRTLERLERILFRESQVQPLDLLVPVYRWFTEGFDTAGT